MQTRLERRFVAEESLVSDCERIVNDLLSATQQFYFQLDKERCERAHREEILKLSRAIQGIAAALDERLNGVWYLKFEELTVHISQKPDGSPLVTAALEGGVTGIIATIYTPCIGESECEDFTLELSQENSFLWRSGAGGVLAAASLVENCFAKVLLMAEKMVRSQIQDHERELRRQLKKRG